MATQDALETEQSVLQMPQIGHDDPFAKVVKTLSFYFVDEISLPYSFEQLRTTSAGNNVRTLVEHLVLNVNNPALINALLTLKWHFSSLEADDHGINETRANACEITAWRFLSRIAERDAVDYCLYQLPAARSHTELDARNSNTDPDENSSLLPQSRPRDHAITRPASRRVELMMSISHFASLLEEFEDEEEDPTSSFAGLNGLEIAAVADCKKFLSQGIVQKIVTGIWTGDITFWESLSEHTTKKPQFYSKRYSDPFTRLRVPRYIKTFEVLFFASFLFLYYAVLVERNPYKITALEIVLYVWFAAFTYDEIGGFIDAGSLFYAVDIWNVCDLAIIAIGAAFLITRVVGLLQDSDQIIDVSFDILSLEALVMVPRICSILSLHPYFGTLIPCLKEMTKDFIKFMVVVGILYIGFLTTFTLLARDHFNLSEMSWILIKVFFGSSSIGFDIMNDISPKLGPPLMLIFVCMTNILLITSLISILSDSFSKVIAHAREEYLFVYSVYVLEASTSNRLTHFYPPLNLIPLIFIRPFRLFIPGPNLRRARIMLLKVTHAPIVAAIWCFEEGKRKLHKYTSADMFSSIGPNTTTTQLTLQLDGSSRSILTPKKQRPFLSQRSQANTNSQHFADFPSPSQQQTTKAREVSQGIIISNSNEALENKVDDLSAKIAELTALIMAQQQGSSGADDL